jgi:hypothetical protein
MPKKGFITPSRFADVLKRGRSKDQEWGETALKAADDVVLDILGVERPDVYSYAIQWGLDNEWEAEQAYQDLTMSKFTRPPFIHHPDHAFIGGNPDGLVGVDGIVEIKCPSNPANHLQNLIDGEQFQTDYFAQIQGYLWITGREWCDGVSFDPRFPDDLKIGVTRIQRDQAFIDALELRLLAFWQIVRARYKQITKTELL